MADTVRARRPRNSLTEDVILAAAEQLATEGFQAVTMRAVADELQASPMALYRHFATKDALVDALLDRVLGRMEFGEDSGDPEADLADLAHRHLALLLAHPWAVAPLIAHPLPGPNAYPIGERALEILARAGVAGDEAVAIFSGILALNYGWASFRISREDPAASSSLRRLSAGTDAPPLTATADEAMQRYGDPAHYDTVIARLVSDLS